MSKNTQIYPHKLLISLSALEQESLVGGQASPILGAGNLFYQKTDVETGGNSNLTLASGDSTSQNTKYKFSQITIGASITFGLPQFNLGKNNQDKTFMDLVKNLVS